MKQLKAFSTKKEEMNVFIQNWDRVRNTPGMEFMSSIAPSRIRNRKLRKFYKKAQKYLGKLDRLLTPKELVINKPTHFDNIGHL